MNPKAGVPQLPEYENNLFISRLPRQMSMRAALTFLNDPPSFKPEERLYPVHIRLQCLYRLRRCFIPLEHHLRLQSAFDTMLRQGYITRNPESTDYIRRLRNGYERITASDLQAGNSPVRSSAEGFALLGTSGAGKTTGVERVLEYYKPVIEHPELRGLKQVTWLKIDCPYRGSPKQLCVNFFKGMDLLLGTDFLARYGSDRASIDLMMAQMAQIANRHALGVLIVDEIQHLKLARGFGPEALLAFLLTMINTIGIPVVLIGTTGALSILQSTFRQARRANGLGAAIWEQLPPGPVWDHFVDELWPYQWTREESDLTDDVRKVLYEESQGIIDVVVKLFMLGQTRAMELGATRKFPEIMNAALLREVAQDHFKIIAPMITALKCAKQSKSAKKKIDQYDDLRALDDHVQEVLQEAQNQLEPQEPSEGTSAQAETTTSTHADLSTETLVTKLKELGLAEDIARQMATNTQPEHPGASLLELVGLISAKLHGRAPESKPLLRSRSAESQRKNRATSQLERSVAVDKKAGKSAHDSLLEAGLVSQPVQDIEG